MPDTQAQKKSVVSTSGSEKDIPEVPESKPTLPAASDRDENPKKISGPYVPGWRQTIYVPASGERRTDLLVTIQSVDEVLP